jgi:hypothetical protein
MVTNLNRLHDIYVFITFVLNVGTGGWSSLLGHGPRHHQPQQARRWDTRHGKLQAYLTINSLGNFYYWRILGKIKSEKYHLFKYLYLSEVISWE